MLFASIVDDPSSRLDEFPTEEDQQRERERLFELIEELVKWENINNERILGQARKEILKSTDGNPPPVLDPFCGGGSIPLEAQRLGLEAHASDLNPVAVLITKAMIEIPPRFAGQPPVNPDARNDFAGSQSWKGATGLAEDVRYYGQWMRDEAEKRIGHLYPKMTLPKEHGGGEATVIAWNWARTVRCPNPACKAKMPLVKQFWLARRGGKRVWVEPIVNRTDKTVLYGVRSGEGIPPEGTVGRRGARCVVCDGMAPLEHVRVEGKAGRVGVQLIAIVVEGNSGRVYLNPSDEHVAVAGKAEPRGVPETNMPEKALGLRVQRYGMTQHLHLFTDRQLTVMTTLSDLVSEARDRIEADAIKNGGTKARVYANAVATYLAFAVSKNSHYWCALSTWHSGGEKMQPVFARQAIPMVWDFSECNPFSSSSGNLDGAIQWIVKALATLPTSVIGFCCQLDAASEISEIGFPLVSTDPPYYDNIGYADLSDFFYIWLRRSLGEIYPDLFKLMLVPKAEELIASPYRFGGDKSRADAHFLKGLGKAFHLMRSRAHVDYPMTVYYAFKQSETDKRDGAIASTAWETMLDGLFKASFQITGTWPMHTEMKARSVSRVGANTLASSIVLVCRPRPDDAETSTRRDFISILRRELPEALQHLQKGNIAPVDLAASGNRSRHGGFLTF